MNFKKVFSNFLKLQIISKKICRLKHLKMLVDVIKSNKSKKTTKFASGSMKKIEVSASIGVNLNNFLAIARGELNLKDLD